MSSKFKGSRRLGRELAFQILYGLSFAQTSDANFLKRTFANFTQEEEKYSEQALSFAWELINGVWDVKEELDSVIGKFSQHWRLERIAKIELTILRLALFEMLYRSDVPLKVAINEGIELSKKFGDEKSRGFVNGILDSAAKSLNTGEIAPQVQKTN